MSRTTGTCTTAPVGGVVAPLPTVRNRAMRRTTDPDVAATSRRYVPAAAPEALRVSVPVSVRERTPAVVSAGFPGRNSAVTPAGRPATGTVASGDGATGGGEGERSGLGAREAARRRVRGVPRPEFGSHARRKAGNRHGSDGIPAC